MISAIFFVTCLDSGGIENYLLRFIREHHQDFKKIVVFCKGGRKGQLLDEYLEHDNVEVMSKKLSYFNLMDYFSLYSYLKSGKFDVMCDFTGNFSGLVLRVGHLASIKNRIAFYRNSSERFQSSYLKNNYNKWIKLQTKKYATKVLSNSKFAFDYFFPQEWQEDSKFAVLYNGVNSEDFLNTKGDLRAELKIPNNAFVVGHTGRYNPAKNHETILDVAEQLIKANDDLYFIMCGNGVKDNLQDKLHQEKTDDRILIFNNRRDISKFLHTMDVYIFPSITEGQPNALLEAMLCGLPFVASNIAPIKEMVPNDFWSYLTDPLDTNKQVKMIQELKSTPMKKNQRENITAHVVNNFNATTQFSQFYEYLSTK